MNMKNSDRTDIEMNVIEMNETKGVGMNGGEPKEKRMIAEEKSGCPGTSFREETDLMSIESETDLTATDLMAEERIGDVLF